MFFEKTLILEGQLYVGSEEETYAAIVKKLETKLGLEEELPDEEVNISILLKFCLIALPKTAKLCYLLRNIYC